MKLLTASVAVFAMLALPGCATVQKNSAFGSLHHGARLIPFDRQGAPDLVPWTHSDSASKPTAVRIDDTVR